MHRSCAAYAICQRKTVPGTRARRDTCDRPCQTNSRKGCWTLEQSIYPGYSAEICDTEDYSTSQQVPPGRKSLKRKTSKSVTDFSESLDKLFDICSCGCQVLESCKCPDDSKVPALEWVFSRTKEVKENCSLTAWMKKTRQNNSYEHYTKRSSGNHRRADSRFLLKRIQNSAIPVIERKLRRELQWLICFLHGNELPLRHFIMRLDGETSGPTSYSGPIGKQLGTCENLPIARFTPIHLDWLSEFQGVDSLSSDQQYLLDICRAIDSGVCDRSL